MIVDLTKALADIQQKRGAFALFALVMRPDSVGRYDLVVSAPWIDAGKLSGTSDFVRMLTAFIGEEKLRQLARVSTLPESHPLVKFLIENCGPVSETELRIRSTDLLEFHVEEAIILQAKAPSGRRGHAVDQSEVGESRR